MCARACVDSRVTGTKEMEGVAERKKLRGMEIEMSNEYEGRRGADLYNRPHSMVCLHRSSSLVSLTSPHHQPPCHVPNAGPLPPVRSQRRKRRRWL